MSLDLDVWEIVIGLEVHTELLDPDQAVLGGGSRFGGEPNTHIDPMTLGLPGALPVPTSRPWSSRSGRPGAQLRSSARCSPAELLLPGPAEDHYQISQYELPINADGWLELPSGKGSASNGSRRTPASRPTLAAAGVSTTPATRWSTSTAPASRCSDRGGRPDLHRGRGQGVRVGAAFDPGRRQRRTARWRRARCGSTATCRSDIARQRLGTRCGSRTSNSLRAMGRAIDYEAARQADPISSGEAVVQQTRHWNDTEGRTTPAALPGGRGRLPLRFPRPRPGRDRPGAGVDRAGALRPADAAAGPDATAWPSAPGPSLSGPRWWSSAGSTSCAPDRRGRTRTRARLTHAEHNLADRRNAGAWIPRRSLGWSPWR